MEKKLVVISAIWCPSCLILKKNLKKLNMDYSNINIEYLDYDLDEELIKKYNIGEILPVIISINDDKEIGRLIGEKSYDDILTFLRESDIV